MSLINEALKKAQKQRTGEAEPLPTIGGESAARIARRGKPAGFSALIVRIVAGAVGVIAIVVVTVIFMRRGPAESAPAQPTPVVAQAPVVQTPVTKPAEAVPQPKVETPAPTVTKPVVVASAPVKIEPAKPQIVETPAPAVVTPAATVPIITTPSTEASRPGRLEARAVTFIEAIRVSGIRASGSDRKVLMNDRVYRLGDLVEPEMGLTLVGIATNALTFQDEKGAKYTRNF
jgi:cytoskeletal protein RodZ